MIVRPWVHRCRREHPRLAKATMPDDEATRRQRQFARFDDMFAWSDAAMLAIVNHKFVEDGAGGTGQLLPGRCSPRFGLHRKPMLWLAQWRSVLFDTGYRFLS